MDKTIAAPFLTHGVHVWSCAEYTSSAGSRRYRNIY